MMQLLCNGVVLDLYDGTSLQFTHKNPLFAFDKLECERTTQFKLPSTPTNDRVLELARVPAYKGTGMRQRFSAELQAGTVVKSGYLYVSEYDGTDYAAIFVIGELVGLQAIKNLGKLADIADWPYYTSAGSLIKNSSDSTFKSWMFQAYRYETPAGVQVMPSINIGKVIEHVCAENNVPVQIPSKAYEMRIALSELKTPPDQDAHMISEDGEEGYYNTVDPDQFIKYLTEQQALEALKTITYRRGHNNPQGEVIQTEEVRKYVEHFKCPNDISITFPADFPDSYFLVYMNPFVAGQCVFLGDYSFTRSINGIGEGSYTTTGTPLAGRTIDIPANTSFILIRAIINGDVSKSDYACRAINTYIEIDDEPVAVTAVTRGWDFAQADSLNYDFVVRVSTSNENVSAWRLQDNLPDITLTDLLKAVAAELGYILNYTESGGIIFESINLSTTDTLHIDTLTKKSSVARTFGNYAQHNYVQFSDDSVFQNGLLTAIDYTINNDNIESESTLLKLPWTCGTQDMEYVRDKVGRESFLEIRYNTYDSGINAMFASIKKIPEIQNLCDASTQYKIEVRMTMMEYNAITAKTLLIIDGTKYTWTERSWQNNTVKFTLAKV